MPRIKKTGVIHDTLTGYDFHKGKDKPLTPMKSIRQKCLECCCGSSNEVKVCTICDCPLWPLRSGKTGRKFELTDEERHRRSENLKKARKKASCAAGT